MKRFVRVRALDYWPNRDVYLDLSLICAYFESMSPYHENGLVVCLPGHSFTLDAESSQKIRNLLEKESGEI